MRLSFNDFDDGLLLSAVLVLDDWEGSILLFSGRRRLSIDDSILRISSRSFCAFSCSRRAMLASPSSSPSPSSLLDDRNGGLLLRLLRVESAADEVEEEGHL